jgi:predicted ArsR family transcriptional regulator
MPDVLQAVGDPALRSALLFVRGQEHATTVDELAAHQGVHRNVARSRLERLCEAGLVSSDFERSPSRVGRPAKTYRAAPHLEPIEFPPTHHETLIALLEESLRDAGGDASAVGVAFGRELARASGLRAVREPAEGVARACAAVRSLGYHAAPDRGDPHESVIVTATCPLRSLVAARPELSAIDRGMWAGIVGAAVAGTEASEISCTTEGCLSPDSPCRVELRFGGGS